MTLEPETVEEQCTVEKTITYAFTSEDIYALLCKAGLVSEQGTHRVEVLVFVGGSDAKARFAEHIDHSCPLVVKITQTEKSTSRC